MAKDRFSNQKPRNYNNDVKHGTHTKMNHYVIPKRELISDNARLFIIDLISKCKHDKQKSFLRSILANQKEPTKPQRKVISKIWNKTSK
tara:strand:+ start:527 stop:793 length:267 start_codon:yes stop_codon:yes gene_type:complete